jgi:uncharacterized protein (TIGR03067 family)
MRYFMTRLSALVAVLATLLVSAVPAAADDKDDPAKAEVKKLTGEWYRSHGLSGGFRTTVQGFSIVMFFEGDRVKTGRIFKPEDAKSLETWTVMVDPAKSPKTIDLTTTKDGQKQTRLGIYELKDNDLKVSWAEDGKERPAKFDDKTTPIDFYFRLEKQK